MSAFNYLFVLHQLIAIITCVTSNRISFEQNGDGSVAVKSRNPIDAVVDMNSAEYERIVTDLMYIQHGVHIDFSYNETKSDDDDDSVSSAPGCPKSLDGRPWIYYGSPRMCYLAGFRGPCAWGRRLFYVENSPTGICNCDCFSSVGSDPESEPDPFAVPVVDYSENELGGPVHSRRNSINYNSSPFARNFFIPTFLGKRLRRSPQRRTRRQEEGIKTHCNRTRNGAVVINTETMGISTGNGNRYKFCYSPSLLRQVAFDAVTQECYPFLEQGPCEKDQWLVKDLETEGIYCEKRKCPEFSGQIYATGGGFTYFDYRRQQCSTEFYGSLRESFFASPSGILSRSRFCRDSGMKYSSRLHTCIKDHTSKFDYRVIG